LLLNKYYLKHLYHIYIISQSISKLYNLRYQSQGNMNVKWKCIVLNVILLKYII